MRWTLDLIQQVFCYVLPQVAKGLFILLLAAAYFQHILKTFLMLLLVLGFRERDKAGNYNYLIIILFKLEITAYLRMCVYIIFRDENARTLWNSD